MSWFSKLRASFERLTASQGMLTPQDFDSMRTILLEADFGPELTEELINILRSKSREITSLDLAVGFIAEKLKSFIVQDCGLRVAQNPPSVYLFVGVNGTGKTTSIAKLGDYLKAKGESVLLACADTFRAAAKEQLKDWAQRAGLPFIGYPTGGDPAALVFDALEMAKQRGIKFLLVDTAGRQHTKANLMEELKKIKKVIGKKKENSPEETLLVLDANSGMNAIAQALAFHSAVGITGIVLTKFDSPARSGFIFTIQRELLVPIKFLGVGEGLADLREFDSDLFLKKFLS